MRGSAATSPAPWWVGGTLSAAPDGVQIAGRSVAALADEFGTPLYLYDGARVEGQVAELRAALGRFKRHRTFFALKSNRFRPLLELSARCATTPDGCRPVPASGSGSIPQ